ncbi:MAG: PUA domain-containing protein [Zestosphaera sp.]
MRGYALRKKDVREFSTLLESKFPKLLARLGELDTGFAVELEDAKNVSRLIVLNGVPALIELKDGGKIPTLVLIKLSGFESTHSAVVDEGAVKYVLNGADVMAPGITHVSSFGKGDVVSVWGPTRETPLCVGRALISGDEIMKIRKGKAIENIHYAGDKIWRVCLEWLAKR